MNTFCVKKKQKNFIKQFVSSASPWHVNVLTVTIVTSIPWDMGTSTVSKTHYGKNYFFPLQLKHFLITQCNCTSIGSCNAIQMNQCLGGGIERAYGYAGIASPPHLRFLRRKRQERSIRSHISGNRGYDSNRVHSLSIFHSYCIEDAVWEPVQSRRAMRGNDSKPRLTWE